ncbi:hypothetical protein [Streptomyces flaveolus]|uniref:hypothetical protein n=1 Tax=Streptomyces flaveolus TaxID=67297 RepID=UPI00380DFF2D
MPVLTGARVVRVQGPLGLRRPQQVAFAGRRPRFRCGRDVEVAQGRGGAVEVLMVGGTGRGEVAQLGQGRQLGRGSHGVRQAEVAGEGILQEPHGAAVSTRGEVGSDQGSLFVEAGALTGFGRGADLGGAVGERRQVQPVRLGHVRRQGVGNVPAGVEPVGEAEVVPPGAGRALSAGLGRGPVRAGDRLDADAVGEPVPAGPPPAGTAHLVTQAPARRDGGRSAGTTVRSV